MHGISFYKFCAHILLKLKLEKDKMAEYTKKAMRSVSEWNRNLLKKKNEERRAYFDMQTFVSLFRVFN